MGWNKTAPQFYFRSNFSANMGAAAGLRPVVSSWRNNEARSVFQLGNQRTDSYRFLELTLTRTFREKYPWLLSYARSRARSSPYSIFLRIILCLHGREADRSMGCAQSSHSLGIFAAPARREHCGVFQ